MYNKRAKNVLKFSTPAGAVFSSWREGLVTGNGIVGINVLGNVGREVVVLNHADLFWQGNVNGNLPDVSGEIKNIVKNVEKLNIDEAQNVITNALNHSSYNPESTYPLPVCDFVINVPTDSSITNYSRTLNLDSGEIRVFYQCKNANFSRSSFVSRVNDLVCFEFVSNTPKSVNFDLSLVLHDKSNNRTSNFETFDVNFNEKTYAQDDFVWFVGKNTDGTDFGCVARVVVNGGKTFASDGRIIVENATSAYIFAKAFVCGKEDEDVSHIKDELLNLKSSYEKMLKEHAMIHANFVNASDLSLFGDKSQDENIDLTYFKAKTGTISLNLIEKLYNYGKHLFAVSCSKRVVPTGLLNGDYKAQDSSVNNYLKLQRIFNFTFRNSLAKYSKPVFERFFDHIEDYKLNAKNLFGKSGIVIPEEEALGCGLPGNTSPDAILNYNVGSFVSYMIFEYFDQTGDVDFIKEKGFEIVKQVGLFYESLFKLNKTTKKFEASFGISPKNIPANAKEGTKGFVASNCLFDFNCAKVVFNILSNLSKTVFEDEMDSSHWEDLASKVPDAEVDSNGLIKEYNTNSFKTNHSSPCIPHLYPFNIGLKPFDSKRDYEDIVANSIRSRYLNCFGKFTADNLCDMSLALATCGFAKDSFEVLSVLLQSFLTKNLLIGNSDNLGFGVGKYEPWPSLEIDKNLQLCQIVQNMFVMSRGDNVYLFRNLPKSFTKGSFSGIVLSNKIATKLDFNLRRGIVKLELKAPKNMTISLALPDGFRRIKGVDAELVDANTLVVNNIALTANKPLGLKIYFLNK